MGFLLLSLAIGLGSPVGLCNQGVNRSDNQILAMGRQKWFEYCTSKPGATQRSGSAAEFAYGEALKRRNSRRLKMRDIKDQVRINAIYSHLDKISGEIGWLEVGSGNGHLMASEIASSQYADMQVLVERLILRRYSPIKRRVASEGRKSLSRLRSRFAQTPDVSENEKARGALAAIRIESSYESLVRTMRNSPPSEWYLVANYCIKLFDSQT